MRIVNCLFITLPFLLFSSCYSIQVIKVRPKKGGVVGINPGFKSISDPEVRAAAMRVMEENCGAGNVKIIEEGYVKVGKRKRTDTESRKRKEYYYSGPETKTRGSSETHTVNINQWQITYACKK